MNRKNVNVCSDSFISSYVGYVWTFAMFFYFCSSQGGDGGNLFLNVSQEGKNRIMLKIITGFYSNCLLVCDTV
jgi:hypothetical protein